MAFRIFIDTEFSNFLDPQLISIGFVAGSGEELYAELLYDAKNCSAFVQEAILPLLNQILEVKITKDALHPKQSAG